MGRILNILYYSPSTNTWGPAKPSGAPSFASNATSLSVAVVQFREVPPESVNDAEASTVAAALSEIIPQRPAVIALNNAPVSVVRHVMTQEWVRTTYAVTEPGPASTLLWHAGLPVQMAEATDRPTSSAINLRKFFGSDCAILAAHIAEGQALDARLQTVHAVLGKGSNDGTTMALFAPLNAPDGAAIDPSKATSGLNSVRLNAKFVEDPKAPADGPTLWLRSQSLAIVSSTCITPPTPSRLLKRAALVALRGLAHARAVASPEPAGSGSDSRTPESIGIQSGVAHAKHQSSVQTTTPHHNIPAPYSGNQQQQQQQAKRRMWSSKHSCSIRIRESTDEVAYDLSAYFPKSEDAIRALTNGLFHWPSDYCVLHGRLLAVHGQNADIPAFRLYLGQHQPPPRPSLVGVPGAVQSAATRGDPTAAPEKRRAVKEPTNFSPYCLTTPSLSSTRRRHWTPNRVAVLYQVTPRELRFDITELVGTGTGKLSEAVNRLNGLRVPRAKGIKPPTVANGGATNEGDELAVQDDLLHHYRHDYALLYSADRSAYWLLSAVDVPCDIAVCRVAAKGLSASVVSLLRKAHGAP